MANQRAATISMKQLSSAADRAIKLAADKHQVKFQNPTLTYVPDWQTLGGILAELLDFDKAKGMAQEITNSINQAAVGGAHEAAASSSAASSGQFQPVVIWNGNHIICGARPAPQIVLGE